MNFRLIATEVGDLLKYDTTVNEIRRAAAALFRFRVEVFPNDNITSARAQEVYNAILSLAKQEMNNDERNELLKKFCRQITPDGHWDKVQLIIEDGLGITSSAEKLTHGEFIARGFHPEIMDHCRKLFSQGNYFHAVFEACKVYNKQVQQKAQSSADGANLMLEVWGCEKGTLKITPCQSETDRNVQDGVKFLSAGLMRAMRNPTAHEPALHWPIGKQDCLDMLSFISFLFRQLDKAVYYKG